MKRPMISFALCMMTIAAYADTATESVLPDNPYMDLYNKSVELEQRYNEAHERETSFGNKLIGAAGIGVTGFGGKMIGEALSEQKADSDIEKEMGAYINTFHCDYGLGTNVTGGTLNVELPGGNDLFNLYAQYATLANDLKTRKTALGIKPGIESEIVLDNAETGLYDDVGTGIVAGSYVSVARALMVPGGVDAIAWANLKQETADKLKTGIIVAGAGAVGSALANQIHNRDKKKPIPEVQELNKSLEQLPVQSVLCPSDTTNFGGTTPNCGTCKDTTKRYNPQSNQCESCEVAGQIVVANQCQCPTDRPEIVDGKCVEKPKTCDAQCGTTAGDHLKRNNGSCTCSCTNNYMPDDPTNATSCSCPDATHIVDNDGNCVQKTTDTLSEPESPDAYEGAIKLPSTAFGLKDSRLSQTAQDKLTDFLNDINTKYTECKITDIDGYADPTGSETTNKTLSDERANSVSEFLTAKISGYSNISITAKPYGHGEYGCTCIKEEMSGVCERKSVGYALSTKEHPTDVVYEPCRRVVVKVYCNKVNNNE